jgi:hypothetical protein
MIEIPAPPPLVWSVMADVARWPEWTASVTRLVVLTPGPLRVGSLVRIHQPRLPPAWWRITELDPGAQFTWVSVAPGLRVTACHAVEPAGSGSRVTLSIRYEGLFGPWLARWTRNLNDRYLAMEAHGLKTRCTTQTVRGTSTSLS